MPNTSTFGKEMFFKTLKCLSSETIHFAFATMAQSTNLLSSLSAFNQPKREMRIFTNHIGPTQYSINNSLRNLRGNVAG